MKNFIKALKVALFLLINPHRVIFLLSMEFSATALSWLSDKLYDASATMNRYAQDKHVNWPLFGAERLGFKKMAADIDKEKSRQAAQSVMPKMD